MGFCGSMGIYKCHGCLWVSMDVYGYLWVSWVFVSVMGFYGCLCVFIDVYGYL